MSANYWESTQRKHWLFTKEELAEMRRKLADGHPDLVQMFPLPSQRHLGIYFNQQLSRLAKQFKVRQQAIATAQVYVKRFFAHVEVRRLNPYLVLASALYLACKIEESPQPIRLVVAEARTLWPELAALDTSRLGECEFFLISEMGSQLVVHQPYRTVLSLHADLGLSSDDLTHAWGVVNDHYMTDLPLLCAPHVVGLAAVLLAVVAAKPGGNVTGAAGGAGDPAGAAAGAAAGSGSTPSGGGGGGGGGRPAATATLESGSAIGALQGVFAGGGPGAGGLLGQVNSPAPPETAKRPAKETDARIIKAQRLSMFLAESTVDIAAVVDCTQELISFYESYEQYNDKQTREQISRLIKARGLDKVASG